MKKQKTPVILSLRTTISFLIYSVSDFSPSYAFFLYTELPYLDYAVHIIFLISFT